MYLKYLEVKLCDVRNFLKCISKNKRDRVREVGKMEGRRKGEREGRWKKRRNRLSKKASMATC